MHIMHTMYSRNSFCVDGQTLEMKGKVPAVLGSIRPRGKYAGCTTSIHKYM